MFVMGIITGIFGWHIYTNYKVAKAFRTINRIMEDALPKMREAFEADRARFDIENKRGIEKNEETKH